MCLIASLRLFWADSGNYGKIWRDSQIWMGIGLREIGWRWGKMRFLNGLKSVLPFQQPLFSFPESKFMSDSDTTLLTWEMCRNLNLFIGLRCLNDPDFSWPRVRAKIGSSQECEAGTWSDINQVWDLTVLTFPRTQDFIQHLLLVMLHDQSNKIIIILDGTKTSDWCWWFFID